MQLQIHHFSMHLFSECIDIWTYQHNYTSLSISIESCRINSTRAYMKTHTHTHIYMYKQIIFTVHVYMVCSSTSYSDIRKSLFTKCLQKRTLYKSKSVCTRVHFLLLREDIFFPPFINQTYGNNCHLLSGSYKCHRCTLCSKLWLPWC
jgi:hypothetical protein